ncbi:hypothetical protein cypCar_00009788 [Cyprinus carpio]|nr:hypothetical protein cypCar_00009788 [Cyprinus carpio]
MDPFDSSSALEGPSKAAATNTEVPVPRSRFSAWLECVCASSFTLMMSNSQRKRRSMHISTVFLYPKSLVVVSRLQFVNLFHSLLKVIAPECFESKNLVWRQNLLPAPTVLPSVHELDLFKCFQSVLVHVQMLWELMLLGEPVVVMAPSPTVSSETVLVLVRQELENTSFQLKKNSWRDQSSPSSSPCQRIYRHYYTDRGNQTDQQIH